MTFISFRTFSLPCSGGVCKSQALPSCTEPLDWEEESVTALHQCQETPFKQGTLFCGSNGTKEVKLTSKVGGGFAEVFSILPCLDCRDLLVWSAGEPCTEDHSEGEKVTSRTCRRRGNEAVGFEEEVNGMYTTHGYKAKIMFANFTLNFSIVSKECNSITYHQ